MVETRSGATDEPAGRQQPEVAKTHKEVTLTETVAGPSGGATGITARAGPATVAGRAPLGLRLGSLNLSPAQLYTLLGLAHALLAIPLVFSWQQSARAAFGEAAEPPDDQHKHLLWIYAAGLASSCATIFALEELARRRMLHTFTADTLNLGLIGHGLAWLALLVMHPTALTVAAALVEGLASLATAALPASQMLATSDDRQRVWRRLQRLPDAMKSLITLRGHGWLSALYAMLAVSFKMAGLFEFAAPRLALIHVFGYDYGISTRLLGQAVGACMHISIMAILAVALKHKADRNYLSSTPARMLNMGLMGTAVGHLLVLGPIMAKGSGAVLLPGAIFVWIVALLTSMLGLSAPELIQTAEEVAKRE